VPLVFLQALQHDGPELATQAARPDWCRLQNAVFKSATFTAERSIAGQQLIENDTERPHVAGSIRLAALAADVFRRHVGQRAHRLVGARHAGVTVQDLGQAEVGDHGLAVFVEQDVARLEVAMHDAGFVCRVDGPRHLDHQRHGCSRVSPIVAAVFREGAARHQRHGVAGETIEQAHRVDRHDVGMAQQRRRPCLAVESLHLGADQRARANALQRHVTPQREVACPVDQPHAAVADLLVHLVLAQRRGGLRDAAAPAAGRFGIGHGVGDKGWWRGQLLFKLFPPLRETLIALRTLKRFAQVAADHELGYDQFDRRFGIGGKEGLGRQECLGATRFSRPQPTFQLSARPCHQLARAGRVRLFG
jgi:hypothetical protein